MRSADDVESRARGWRTLAALHVRIEDALAQALREAAELPEPAPLVDALAALGVTK
ncbi:hypothetical protein ACQPZF_12435 [Actinosynnema sp. CS-041913]|uniref:hypothetical protein n=1 Tax=Actinosynnema sp. CS-041913 TaxID=3239917 RepID=UPI003D8C5010